MSPGSGSKNKECSAEAQVQRELWFGNDEYTVRSN